MESLVDISGLPHPLEELFGRPAFNNGISDVHDRSRLGKPIEQWDELFGGVGTEPADDHPVNQLALPQERSAPLAVMDDDG